MRLSNVEAQMAAIEALGPTQAAVLIQMDEQSAATLEVDLRGVLRNCRRRDRRDHRCSPRVDFDHSASRPTGARMAS